MDYDYETGTQDGFVPTRGARRIEYKKVSPINPRGKAFRPKAGKTQYVRCPGCGNKVEMPCGLCPLEGN